MGLDCTICFPTGVVPPWDAIRDRLARIGEPAPLRLIDGLPAFPDESPAPGWLELRIGFPAGMVTLRLGSGVLKCVIWSNADAALVTARDRLAWACAAAGDGVVATPNGESTADNLAQQLGLSPS